MATTNEEMTKLEEKTENLKVSEPVTIDDDDKNSSKCLEPHLSGFETHQLYKIALNFYKGTNTNGILCRTLISRLRPATEEPCKIFRTNRKRLHFHSFKES